MMILYHIIPYKSNNNNYNNYIYTEIMDSIGILLWYTNRYIYYIYIYTHTMINEYY